jgi:hypothetical protein
MLCRERGVRERAVANVASQTVVSLTWRRLRGGRSAGVPPAGLTASRAVTSPQNRNRAITIASRRSAEPTRYHAAMTPHPDPPPPVLGRCVVRRYASTAGLPFAGSNLFVDGTEVGRVPRLAIGRQLQAAEILLLHCDDDWDIVGTSAHATIAEAETRAFRIYPGIEDRWIDRPVTDEEAVQYLQILWAGETCSFCGRRPDEVAKMVAGGDTRICDLCIRDFHARTAAERVEE